MFATSETGSAIQFVCVCFKLKLGALLNCCPLMVNNVMRKTLASAFLTGIRWGVKKKQSTMFGNLKCRYLKMVDKGHKLVTLYRNV